MSAAPRSLWMRSFGERGATGVEYGLMVALIAMAMMGALFVLGPNLNALFDQVANSLTTPAPAPPPAPPPAPQPSATASVYYEDCDDVRAAGADPIRVGDPGYSLQLDPDGDGVGCE